MIARVEFDYRVKWEELVKNPVTLAVLQSAIHDAPQGEEALSGYRWPRETLIDLDTDGPRLSSVGVEFTVKSFKGTLPLQSILPDGKNYTVHVHIPNLGLLTMDEVMVEEDCCTDNLLAHALRVPTEDGSTAGLHPGPTEGRSMMDLGIPTALSPHETRVLQRLTAGKRVVEAGALLGFSTVAMAAVAASVISIDKHVDYSGPTYRQFRSNLERAGVASRVTPVMGDAVTHLSKYQADVAFTDLTSEYTLTKAAALAAQAPLVAIHDFSRSRCEGVGQVVDALGWQVIERADTLIVLEKPMKTTTTVKKRTELKIDHRDIMGLSCVKHALSQLKGVVGPVTVTYTVPGGGDWSGMDAPVDTEHPLTIVIESEERE